MADSNEILRQYGQYPDEQDKDYNFVDILRDTTLGGLLTKFLMEHPLNIWGNNEAMDSKGRTYGQSMLQNDRSGRKPITGADGYKYWSDSGERVLPEQNRMGKAADGYYYYQDSGERVLPDINEMNISRGEQQNILQDRERYQSQKAKDIQNLWKGLK